MQEDATHLSDVCVRFVGQEGESEDILCSSGVLFKASSVLRAALDPDGVRLAKRTADGRIILPILNDRISPRAVRDALELLHGPATSLPRWPEEGKAVVERAAAASEACRYLDLGFLVRVFVQAAIYKLFQLRDPEPLAFAAEALDIGSMSANRLHAVTREITSVAFLKATSLGGVHPVAHADVPRVLRPIVFAYRAVKAHESQDILEGLRLCDHLEEGLDHSVGMADFKPATFLAYVEACARADDAAELDVACDLALIRGVPPVAIAMTLLPHGRLTLATYNRIVTANMDDMTALDFALLGAHARAATEAGHALVGDVVRGMHRPCASIKSVGRSSVGAPVAFLVDPFDGSWKVSSHGVTLEVKVDGGNTELTVTADMRCSLYVWDMDDEDSAPHHQEMSAPSMTRPLPRDTDQLYVLVVPDAWTKSWFPSRRSA